MTNLQCIKHALDYLEKHIEEDIGLKDIAGYVNFSEYHFHRMFKGITDYSLKDYIRRRRLYLAALDIVNTNESIAIIAQKYQFSSQASFTVSFGKMHGTTPGRLRVDQGNYKTFVKMIANEVEMDMPKGLSDPVLVTMDEILIEGIVTKAKTSQLKSEDNPISLIWDRFRSNEVADYAALNDLDTSIIFAIYDYDPRSIFSNDMQYVYTLGYQSKQKKHKENPINGPLVKKRISPGGYLKFDLDFSITDHTEAYDYIDGRWLPKSDYILSESSDFEMYFMNKGKGNMEIYISVEDRK